MAEPGRFLDPAFAKFLTPKEPSDDVPVAPSGLPE
jgi:hypothetical protein